MLVLSRKPKETIMIGDNIRVMIVSAKNGRVRVAIEAPRELTVLREEVHRPEPAETR